MSRPYSHCAMRPLWCRPLSRLRTPCGLPMKSVPTWFLIQKSMTLRVALCRRSRTRRSARRHTLFFARCSFFQRRECFWHRLCFLASCPSCWLLCRLRARMPRPVTISALPVLVVTAAGGFPPDRPSPGPCREPLPPAEFRCRRATRSPGSRLGCTPRRLRAAQAAEPETGGLCPSARRRALSPGGRPGQAT